MHRYMNESEPIVFSEENVAKNFCHSAVMQLHSTYIVVQICIDTKNIESA